MYRLIPSLSLLSLTLTACSGQPPTLSGIFDKILWFGSLGFIGNNPDALVGFMRILLAILVFALLFEGGKVTGMNPRTVGIVAAIIAIISAIFIPDTVLVAIGAAYGTIVALVLIGVPVLGGLYAIWRIPGDTRPQILFKILILFLLLVILISINEQFGVKAVTFVKGGV
ncbi:MAG: hypothetical protein AABX05_05975 [Nanoarchaeota archaeon]